MPFLHADPASCSQMAGGAYRRRCCPAVHNTRQTGRATSPWAGSTWQCVGRPQSSVEMLTWIMAVRAHHSSSNANSSFLENVRPHPVIQLTVVHAPTSVWWCSITDALFCATAMLFCRKQISGTRGYHSLPWFIFKRDSIRNNSGEDHSLGKQCWHLVLPVIFDSYARLKYFYC